MDLILSGVMKGNDKLEDCARISDNATFVMPTLVSSAAEADTKIVPHVNHAVDNGYKRTGVVSNGTNVVALVL